MYETKQCPFCGDDGAYFSHLSCAVICITCGARGPALSQKEELDKRAEELAKGYWNMRYKK